MKLFYVPAILGFLALVSLGSNSIASTEPGEPAMGSSQKRSGLSLQTEPLLSILSGMAAAEPREEASEKAIAEEAVLAETSESEAHPVLGQRDDPRHRYGEHRYGEHRYGEHRYGEHRYGEHCPACGMG